MSVSRRTRTASIARLCVWTGLLVAAATRLTVEPSRVSAYLAPTARVEPLKRPLGPAEEDMSLRTAFAAAGAIALSTRPNPTCPFDQGCPSPDEVAP
ncbi:hypothetical protein OV090_26030 [Nannocystis sp. RBIL2]|uniref:hypothetical protein n=1 Tax=Nannocystis sp. RBIL2 TaxID=2996788 RepID=UPI00226F2D9D|nr:hypothetical protein [Nannocystis sp. RBIL2]MCY1068228.1 hypothetical protein [Nannocystis sp. RBIL2]